MVAGQLESQVPGQTQAYCGQVFDLSGLDLVEIATALADQTDYEHRWLINPRTGEIMFWTADQAARLPCRRMVHQH